MSQCYNHNTKRYKGVRVGIIIEEYYDNSDYKTFYALFSDKHLEALKEIGFKSWRKKLTRTMVKYIVEEVLKDGPPDS